MWNVTNQLAKIIKLSKLMDVTVVDANAITFAKPDK
jgi:hypothetical protein